MRMNTSIPMMGQQPDIVNVLRQANVAGQERRDFDRTNALRAMLMEQGPGIMAGEQNALAALAQYDPQAALGVQDARLGMDQTRLSMDLARRQDGRQAQESQMRLRVLGRQEAAAIEQEAAQRTAAEREQARRELAITMTALNNAQSPQEWDQIASGLDPSLVGSFQNREMIIAGLQDTDEIIAGLTGGQRDDLPAAEQEIRRVMELGYTRQQAIQALSLNQISRDPVTGQATVIDRMTGENVSRPAIAQDPVAVQAQEAPRAIVPEDTDFSEATGIRGMARQLTNTLADAFGAGLPFPNNEQATQAMQSLQTRTMTTLAMAVPGRPSNYLLEQMQSLTATPNSVWQGEGRTRERLSQIYGLLNEALIANQQAVNGEIPVSPTMRAEAAQNVQTLSQLLADYERVLQSYGQGGDTGNQTSNGVTWRVIE